MNHTTGTVHEINGPIPKLPFSFSEAKEESWFSDCDSVKVWKDVWH
jgi:hypothetical protein